MTNKYVMRTTGNVYLHRYIMQLEGKLNQGDEVDHEDTDELNNMVSNLRMCNRAENLRNTKKSKNCTSKFKGVCWNTQLGKWMARITYNNTTKYLGTFFIEEEAAMAYDRTLRALPVREEFKRYNFIVL